MPGTKTSKKNTQTQPSQMANQDKTEMSVSDKNSSRYAPTPDAISDVQLLGAEDGLMKLFTDSVKDLYWAENSLLKALPKMAKASGSDALREAILNHREQTVMQVQRLEEIFGLLGKAPMAKKCDAIEGLIKEGEGIIEDTDPGSPARDLGIIMASQKVEHYEISAYTGLKKLAEKLNLVDAADLLAQTLEEEMESDKLLGDLSEQTLTRESREENA